MAKETKEKLTKQEEFMAYIESAFGKRNNPLEKDPENIKIEKFSTGSMLLDKELKGGYAKGTVIEIYGKSGSGKTTLCVHAVAEHQKKYTEEKILWVDLEKVFDPVYFTQIGIDVDPEKFHLINDISKGEDVWEIILNFTKIYENGLVILDSVAGLLPAKEDEGMIGDAQMAGAARMNSQAFRKLMPYLGFGRTTFIAINQVRKNIGVTYGSDEVTSGGGSWEYYCRTRIKTASMKGNPGEYRKHRFTLNKANYGNRDAEVETIIEYGTGFNRTREIIETAIENKILTKAGAWIKYGEDSLASGLDNTVDLLNDNPELLQEIETKINEL